MRSTRYGGGYSHSVLGVQIGRNRSTYGRGGYSYGGVYGGLRYGYVGYDSYWRDDFFGFPYYVFNPYASGVVCYTSPWYAYSYLPPYIDGSHVTVVNDYRSDWSSEDNRDDDWQNYNDRDGRNEDLNDAIDDVRNAFERNSSRDGGRLIPDSGQIAILNGGKYDYSLAPDDFADMFLDGIKDSKTTSYRIVEVKTRGDEVHLRAKHEYTDSWGETQSVFHTYTLRREAGHYVIREFGTE